MAAMFGLVMALPAAAQDWPVSVAASGCKFNWVGTDGFQETTVSGGVGHFPTLLFSQEKNWPALEPFVPFCGEHCRTEADRWALFELFPLAVGKTALIGPEDDQMIILVEDFVEIRALGGIETYQISATRANAQRIISYWAPQVGWVVRLDEADFSKVVVTMSCPQDAEEDRPLGFDTDAGKPGISPDPVVPDS
ncbi:hypothetical protein [Actibacterium sp. 188UL27-1]|uniref:hypothetical protein n=1 Tax=Actibacterium sp. 188UL27-1 TaxID=2786961 RepID=UPI00195B3871|nr:hypothetical protein [Actibacterium sp. 188UL27-1]MBM7069598.1 hypothetical protein [Actibacterium sp. 188UL27-1]